MGCVRSPFLNIGCGPVYLVPCFSETRKNSVNVGVSSSASVVRVLVGIRSGPVALYSLSVDNNLCTPFNDCKRLVTSVR